VNDFGVKTVVESFFSSTDDGGGVDADADHALSVGVLDDGLGDDLFMPFRGQIAIF